MATRQRIVRRTPETDPVPDEILAARRRLSALEEIEEASRAHTRFGQLPPRTVTAGMFSLSLALIFLGGLGTAVILKYQVPVGLIAGIGAVLTVLGFFVIRALYKGPRSYADHLQGLVATYLVRESTDPGQEQAHRICASPAALQGWVAKERAMLRAELARRVA